MQFGLALLIAKPPAIRSQRLCLRPPSRRFLGRPSLGRQVLRVRTFRSKKADAGPDWKDYRSQDGFFAAFGTRCGKGRAPTSFHFVGA